MTGFLRQTQISTEILHLLLSSSLFNFRESLSLNGHEHSIFLET
ncbi:unnamed protein product [Arabidopsis halleri]